jgi:hypothetical protein
MNPIDLNRGIDLAVAEAVSDLKPLEEDRDLGGERPGRCDCPPTARSWSPSKLGDESAYQISLYLQLILSIRVQ